MTNYYSIEPLSPGSLGPHARMESNHGEVKVESMHVVLDYFPENIFEIANIYFVLENLKNTLETLEVSGIEFGDVEVTVDKGDFERNAEGKKVSDIPKVFYLKNIGRSGQDDFGIKRNEPRDFRLVVSQRVLEAINNSGASNIIVEEWNN